jgi:tetratricopeptide (TPR) repeat protein
MNDSDRDRIISDYIRQAMDIQNGKSSDIPDLNDVVRELGMTDEEIAQVHASAREHFERGSGYCRHEQWDDAINELKIATALDPMSADALYMLAKAYAGRWEEKKHKDDRAEAERFAKRSIDLKPNNEDAFALLERLNGHTPQAKAVTSAQGAMKRVWIMVGVFAVVILGIGVGIFTTVSSVVSTSVNSVKDIGKSTAFTVKGRPIPVSLAGQDGATLQLDDARLYPKDNTCCVRGDVTPTSDMAEAKGIDLELDLIDSSDNVAETDRFTAWPCSKHPGSFNFHRDNPIVPRIKEARLIVQ